MIRQCSSNWSTTLHDRTHDASEISELKAIGIATRRENGRTSIRLSGYGPVAVFFAVLFIGIVLCGFAYPIWGLFTNRTQLPAMVVAAATLTIAIVAYLAASARAASISLGRDDLILDDERRELTLPSTHGRSIPAVVSFDSVAAVRAVDYDIAGGMQFHVILEHRRPDGEICREIIVTWSDFDRTRQFMRWLAHRLNLNADESGWNGAGTRG